MTSNLLLHKRFLEKVTGISIQRNTVFFDKINSFNNFVFAFQNDLFRVNEKIEHTGQMGGGKSLSLLRISNYA